MPERALLDDNGPARQGNTRQGKARQRGRWSLPWNARRRARLRRRDRWPAWKPVRRRAPSADAAAATPRARLRPGSYRNRGQTPAAWGVPETSLSLGTRVGGRAVIGGGSRPKQQVMPALHAAHLPEVPCMRGPAPVAWQASADECGGQVGAQPAAQGRHKGRGRQIRGATAPTAADGSGPTERRAAIKRGRELAAAHSTPPRSPPLHPLPARLIRAAESRKWTTPAPSSAE